MSVKCNFGSLFELEEYKFSNGAHEIKLKIKNRRHHGPRAELTLHSKKGNVAMGMSMWPVGSGAVRYGTVDEDLVLENEIIRET